jgi:hypothetical protein
MKSIVEHSPLGNEESYATILQNDDPLGLADDLLIMTQTRISHDCSRNVVLRWALPSPIGASSCVLVLGVPCVISVRLVFCSRHVV